MQVLGKHVVLYSMNEYGCGFGNTKTYVAWIKVISMRLRSFHELIVFMHVIYKFDFVFR